jgi:hypothetical protein
MLFVVGLEFVECFDVVDGEGESVGLLQEDFIFMTSYKFSVIMHVVRILF